jgi:GNAT superfamily N-acetyltransferase
MSARWDAAALWQVYVDALKRRSDSEVVDRPDWLQIRTPSSPHATHNRVARARLSAQRAPEVIAEVIADHAKRGAGFGWAVGPDSSPSELSDWLERAGIPKRGNMIGMAREVDEAPPSPLGVDLVVEPAQPGDAERIAEVNMRAQARSEAFRRSVEDAATRALSDPNSDTRYWLALHDEELVGTATLRLLSRGVGYLQGGFVLPAYRGRGIYRALTRARIEALSQRGFRHVIIWANDESAPICEKMGFRAMARGAYHDLGA